MVKKELLAKINTDDGRYVELYVDNTYRYSHWDDGQYSHWMIMDDKMYWKHQSYVGWEPWDYNINEDAEFKDFIKECNANKAIEELLNG